MSPRVTDTVLHYILLAESNLLLWFLDLVSVPRAPEINVSSCGVCDNTIMVSWRPAYEGDRAGDISPGGPIEKFDLEYRKTNHNGSLLAAAGARWEEIHDIKETHITVSGQRSHQPQQESLYC